MIPVNRPFLPPIEEYEALVQDIYKRNILTNDGPLLQQLEQELAEFLGVKHLAVVSNGTMALQIAIKSLNLTGKVITTPFSYVATVSSLVWEGCEPVFVDIEPHGYNINVSAIEKAITEDVTAILATHCFGFPCDVEAIEAIAEKHNLKVVYDGAHAIGSEVNGRSVFHFGDITTSSLHATKLIHSIEGGLLTTPDEALIRKIKQMRNFGHDGAHHFNEVGINGKSSEFHAAMGLTNLKHVNSIFNRRYNQCLAYNEALSGADLILPDVNDIGWNRAYYPLLFPEESICIHAMKTLESQGISSRRYFYPSLNQVNLWPTASCKTAERTSRRILCLPLYHTLTLEEIRHISNCLLTILKKIS